MRLYKQVSQISLLLLHILYNVHIHSTKYIYKRKRNVYFRNTGGRLDTHVGRGL